MLRYQIECYPQDIVFSNWLIQTTARYQIYCYRQDPAYLRLLVNLDNGEISDILLLTKNQEFRDLLRIQVRSGH